MQLSKTALDESRRLHNDIAYFGLRLVQADVTCEQKVQFLFCFLIKASLVKFLRMICAVCYDPIVFLEQ